MLRVIYSNQTEELLRALVERISADRVDGGPNLFEPVHLVVPNHNVKAFVELGIARLEGISAIIESRTLPEFLASITGGPTPESRLFDRLLSVLFDDSFLARPELFPVRDYLHAASNNPEENGPATDRRRVQLARKLARLFSRYEVFRPELLECWRAGLFLGDPDLREVETWQRKLWLQIEDTLRPSSDTFIAAPPVVHLFGISYMARSQVTALGGIAEKSDVIIYKLNPCQELWEATATPIPLRGEAPRRYERRGSDLGPGEVFSTEDPFRLSNPGEMLPLRLWGKPGREDLRLLNALTGCELSSRVREPEGKSLLHQIQRDIVSRRPQRDSVTKGLDFGADESIVFLECGSARRELEVIAAEIWSLLSKSEAREGEHPLRFDDIAVLLPSSQAERYQSLLGTVFQESQAIPHNVVDLPIEVESPIAGAALLLLDVPLGRFTLSSLVRFATHPVVMDSFPGSTAEEWIRFADSLGSRDSDVVDWDRKLNDLALGALMEGREGVCAETLDAALGSVLPDVDADSVASAGSFGLLLRSLMADAKEASRALMTLPAWMDFVSALLSTYVEARSEEDEHVLKKCLTAVSTLAEMDVSGRKLRYHVAHELVRAAIHALSGSRGQYLRGGVSVSSFLPMRAVPFRVVFVAGLSQHHFPARDGEDQLDLRRAHRRAGDVGLRDEDRYLFLETLLCARERIYFSWTSRDLLHRERIPPSSVLSELVQTLVGGYVAEGRLSFRRHRLERSDDPRTRSAFPEAARESHARALGDHLRGYLGVSRLPALEKVRAALPEKAARALGWPALPRKSSTSVATAIGVDLATVREFLECPLQGSARFHLRWRDDEEEEGRRHRPSGARVLLEALRAGGSVEAYEQAARQFMLECPLERRRHLGVLAVCQGALRSISNGTEPRFAPAEESSALVLHVSSRRIEISRRPAIRLEKPRALLHLASKDPERLHPQKESLKGFVDHVFSCAAGLDSSEPYTFITVNAPPRGDARSTLVRFAPIEPDRARVYLEEIVSELLAGVHEYLLPCEAVFGSIDPAKLDRTSSALGPVPHPEDYRRLVESEREATVRSRFGLYFESVLPVGETS